MSPAVGITFKTTIQNLAVYCLAVGAAALQMAGVEVMFVAPKPDLKREALGDPANKRGSTVNHTNRIVGCRPAANLTPLPAARFPILISVKG
jgi:hypothetical protein